MLLLSLALAGCAPVLGGADVGVRVGGYVPGGVGAGVVAGSVSADWWRGFGSAGLDGVVEAGLRASPTVAQAGANLLAARADEAANDAAFLPQVGLNPGQPNVSRTAEPGGPNGFPPYTIYALGGSVSYDPGLFGARRYTFENGAALVDYQAAQVEAARQSLAGNIVAAVILAAGYGAQIATTEDILSAERKLLNLLQGEYADGAISRLTVLQQQSQILATQTSLPGLRTSLAQQRDRLAVLMGRMPGDFVAPDVTLDALRVPAPVPVVVPSAYLADRPDLVAARANVAAQNAALGIAVSHLYPDLQLSAAGGWVGESFNMLFNTDTAFWSLAGNLLAPIYEGGALRARKAAAQAQLAAALAAYHDAVFNAFGEAADALQAVGNDEDAVASAGQEAATAVAAYQLAEAQYSLGAADYTTVLTAQAQAAQAALAAVQARAALLLDVARLQAAMAH